MIVTQCAGVGVTSSRMWCCQCEDVVSWVAGCGAMIVQYLNRLASGGQNIEFSEKWYFAAISVQKYTTFKPNLYLCWSVPLSYVRLSWVVVELGFWQKVQIFCIIRCRLASILQKGLSRSFSTTKFCSKRRKHPFQLSSQYSHTTEGKPCLPCSLLQYPGLTAPGSLPLLSVVVPPLWLLSVSKLQSSVIPVTTDWATVDPTMAGLYNDS